MGTKTQLKNLTLFRIVICILVFLFHTFHGLSVDYGHANIMFQDARIYMSSFFILSGFLLYYNYSDRKIDNINALWIFIKKRMRRIFPYFFVVYAFIFILSSHNSIIIDLVNLPFEAMLLSSTVSLDYLMNNGSWFLSCIFICYLLFPYLLWTFKQLSYKMQIAGIVLLYILISDVGLLGYYSGISYYSNVFVRLLEFAFGCLLCILYMGIKGKIKNLYIGMIAFISLISYVTIIFLKINSPWYMAFYTAIIAIVIESLAMLQSRYMDVINNSPLVRFLGKYSFEIWIATFISTEFINRIVYKLWPDILYGSNFGRLIICFAINLVIAICLQKCVDIVLDIYSKLKLSWKFIIVMIMVLAVFALTFIPKQLRSGTRFDFVNYDIHINNNMSGIDEDEGSYAWCNSNARVVIYPLEFMNYSKLIVSVSGDSRIINDGNESQIIQIYVNDLLYSEFEIVENTVRYEFSLPKEVLDGKEIIVDLKSNKSNLILEGEEEKSFKLHYLELR